MRRTAIFVAAVVGLGLAGCRASSRGGGACAPQVELPRLGGSCASVADGTAPTVSKVMPGDTLIGNLRPGQCQCFHFDGVAYTLLDLDLAIDCADGAPPTLTITDPEGHPVDVPVKVGKGGMSATGIVLRRTGTYAGKLCREACGAEQLYRFSYAMRLAEVDDQRFFLTPESNEKVSFIATRGANCVLYVRPEHACGVTPKVLMVKGPDGLRALAVENQLEGACPPRVMLDRGATRVLKFIAPQPGRYTVHLAAEEGTEGDATTHVSVFPPRSPDRKLFHDGRDCSGGSCPPPLAQSPAPAAPAPVGAPMPPPPPAPADDCPECRPPVASASYVR